MEVRTTTQQFEFPSSQDPSSLLQNLNSSFARFSLSDVGSSLPDPPPPPPPPWSQFEYTDASLPHLPIHRQQQQQNYIDLENRIRMREALAPQMTSSSSSSSFSSFSDYYQSMAPTQFGNFSDGDLCSCNCCLHRSTSNSMHALLYSNKRGRGSTSDLIQRYPNRNQFSPRPDIVQLAKEQQGCHLLQKGIKEASLNGIQIIFSVVKDHICELMTDAFGNYFVQKLIEVCSEEQRTEVILIATRKEYQLISICLDMHGSRAVQKLLQHLTTPQQIILVISALRPGTICLINNINGHHVVQHCFDCFSSEYNKCLADEIADHCVDVAMHPNGCCVLQKCLSSSEGEQRERLLVEIISNALILSQDQYGNYVVQYVLGLKIPHITASLLRQLEGSYGSLSVQKFSSNVVEKCLKESHKVQRTRIIKELLDSPHAVMIMQNAYGNYVMQSALVVSKGPILSAIVNLVERMLPILKSHPYGKMVVARKDQVLTRIRKCT